MSGDLSGYVNVINVLGPTTPVQAIRTSEYVSMEKYDKVLFVASAMPDINAGATGQVEMSVLAAYTATGGGSQALGIYTTMNASGAALTVTRAAGLALFSASSWVTSQTFVINGITYTLSTVATYTTATFTSDRIVGITVAPNSSVEYVLNHFAAYINHANYGVPNVYAEFNSTHSALTVASSHNLYIAGKGDATVTCVANSSMQMTAVKYVSISEVTGADLMSAGSSSKWVAISLTPTSMAKISVVAVRSRPRYIQSNTGCVADYAIL